MRGLRVSLVVVSSCVSMGVAVAVMLVSSCVALAGLSDNRVYELVSPVETGGQIELPRLAVAEAGGERVVVDGGQANALLSSNVSWELETRTPAGWSGVQVGPAPGPGTNFVEQREVLFGAVSEDFSRFLFSTEMPLEARDPGRNKDIYVRNGSGGPLEWVSGPPSPLVKGPGTILGVFGPHNEALDECTFAPNCEGNDAWFAGASRDLSDLVWEQREALVAPPASLSGAPADTHAQGYEVYESVGGVDQLVGQVPASGVECDSSSGGCVVPPCGAAMGNEFYEVNEGGEGGTSGFAPVRGAVSAGGSEVVFTSPDPVTEVDGCPAANVYVRRNGTSTVEVSASQKTNGAGVGGGDPNGPRPSTYVGSAEAGGRIATVFFTSSAELTNDADTGSDDQGEDLYAYDLATGALSDLTVDSSSQDPNGASVGGFVGSAADGSLVYFTASGVLAPGASAGQENLYVRNTASGQTTFIAPAGGVSVGAERGIGSGEFEVTADGGHLLFLDSESLTPYQQQGNREVYLYEAAGDRLVCVSCNPSGTAPGGEAALPGTFPEAENAYPELGTLPAPRAISDDGSRVFFTSPDALVAGAPQGQGNVYEYEHGNLYLIAPSAELLTTTPSGDDVFFSTVAQLVAQDRDTSPDVYDARVDGGFPAPAAQACSGTSCQGVPASPPVFATPSSVTFNGVGNFSPPAPTPAAVKSKSKPKAAKCKKGFVKKQNKCVKKPKAKKPAKGRK
jgi:hypothetical protein